MKVIVGLGNPGSEYENTRHNVGFMVVDELKNTLAEKQEFQYNKKFKAEICKMGDLVLVKPNTFMNRSGEAVSRIANFYKTGGDELYIVHDDLDIELGEWKVDYDKGPKDHGGVNSIEQELGNGEFWRVRVGVDSRSSENRIPGEKYVLLKLSKEEKVIISDIVKKVARELLGKIQNS